MASLPRTYGIQSGITKSRNSFGYECFNIYIYSLLLMATIPRFYSFLIPMLLEAVDTDTRNIRRNSNRAGPRLEKGS